MTISRVPIQDAVVENSFYCWLWYFLDWLSDLPRIGVHQKKRLPIRKLNITIDDLYA